MTPWPCRTSCSARTPDLSRAPYVLYRVKYIDLVSLQPQCHAEESVVLHLTLLDLGRPPYAVYGVKQIDLVSHIYNAPNPEPGPVGRDRVGIFNHFEHVLEGAATHRRTWFRRDSYVEGTRMCCTVCEVVVVVCVRVCVCVCVRMWWW